MHKTSDSQMFKILWQNETRARFRQFVLFRSLSYNFIFQLMNYCWQTAINVSGLIWNDRLCVVCSESSRQALFSRDNILACVKESSIRRFVTAERKFKCSSWFFRFLVLQVRNCWFTFFVIYLFNRCIWRALFVVRILHEFRLIICC